MSRLSIDEHWLSALSTMRQSAPAWLTTPWPNRCPSPTGSGSAMATATLSASVNTTPADKSARRMIGGVRRRNLDSLLRHGWYRMRFGIGSGLEVAPVDIAPPGFGRSLDYPEVPVGA